MKKPMAVLMLTLSVVACSKKDQAKTIEHYVANIEEARAVIKDCESRIETASDLPKVMAEENCANAKLAISRWSEEYSRVSGKPIAEAPVRVF